MFRLLILIFAAKITVSIVVTSEDFSGTITNRDERDNVETVKSFLNHYNSLKPVAVLVDDTEESCESAKRFIWKVLEVAPRTKQMRFYISKFNDSGITPSNEVLGNDNDEIRELLSYQQQSQSSFLGSRSSNGTLAFFAILNAAAALPMDSAIIMFIDRNIQDEDLAQHVGILNEKSIKVYVVWGGYSSTTNEEKLLHELCSYTSGLFLRGKNPNQSNYNHRRFLEKDHTKLNTSLILYKYNLHGRSAFTFPIDGEVNGIYIVLTPPHIIGSLTSPEGYTLDLQDNGKIAEYGGLSFGATENELREIYVDATAPRRIIGQWRIEMEGEPRPYNLSVFVHTPLTARAYLLKESSGSTNTNKTVIKLGITGHVSSINNVSFLDKNGHQFFKQAVSHQSNRDWLDVNNSATNKKYKEIDVEVDDISHPYNIIVHGKDGSGNEFSRMTYVEKYNSNNINIQPSLVIDVAQGSELITVGGRRPVILFEVTNLKNTATDVRFFAKDQSSLLYSIDPYRKIINPQETAIVRITLITRYGNYQDEVTLIAGVGGEEIEKHAIVDVGEQTIIDNNDPSLDYSYLSDCSKVVFSSCEDGTWRIEVKSKDTGSGLLQVTSQPRGLYFPNGFTTGTKEEVTGTYSDSCCRPDLQLTAIDRMNNRKIVYANAYRASWSPAQISALVLGILLLILIIIIIVYFVRKCIKNKENYDLPTHRGGRI